MTFEILIATMYGTFFEKNNTVPAQYLVINQDDRDAVSIGDKPAFTMSEKGLAKSRNKALALTQADIVHIADDDLGYKENIEKTIIDAFRQYPEADIITFQIETPEGEQFKDYSKEIFWHTSRSIMRTCSVEIALRIQSVKKYNLQFDENFGLGAPFPTGEEIIFLTDAFKKGLKILYIPKPIVIHPKESSGSAYANTALLEAKGAMFYRIFGVRGYAISALYAWKKYRHSPMGMLAFVRYMHIGIKQYRRKNER